MKKSKEEAKDAYIFTQPKNKDLFHKIIHEFRCTVCQNQNISDSMAPLAVDLRQEIYYRVLSNQSEKEITDFVTSRYGEFILYRPPFHEDTYFLWGAPFAIFLLSMVIFTKYLK